MRALEFAFRQIVELAAGIDLFGFVLSQIIRHEETPGSNRYERGILHSERLVRDS
jgi:hypothetical protein